MSTSLLAALLVLVWVGSGLFTAVFFYGRSGRRSPLWYVISVILGPFSLPIGYEMSQDRTTQVVQREPAPSTRPEPATPTTTVRVLAAVDGSPEAREAVRSGLTLLGDRVGALVLVHVLDPDAVVMDEELAVQQGRSLLHDAARLLPDGTPPPAVEVAAGRPADVLLELADRESADLLVLGHRGQGLSRAVLGSVSDEVVRRSALPVLVGGRTRPDAR